MKTTLELDDRLLERAKRLAAENGTTLRAVVEDALRARLAPRPARREGYHFNPPIVHGTRPPRVDVADRQTLYDILDEPRLPKRRGATSSER
jgi:hypothetical protein